MWIKYPLLGALLALLWLGGAPALRVLTHGRLFGFQVTRPPLGGRTEFNVLILGLDQPDKLNPKLGRRTDSMLLAHVDLPTRMVTGFSIPRDTRVRFPEAKRWIKVNAAYSEGGYQASMDIVRAITGVRPDYYVVVDTSSTRNLVDLVGGVDVTVDHKMDYDDNWQDLHIHLDPGEQRLDGAHAIQFLRFRHDRTGDIARMHRQQQFVSALAKQISAPGNLPKLPWIAKELRKQVQTDMEDTDLLFLARELRGVQSSHLMFDTLEGESRTIGGADYFLPYGYKMKQTILKSFPGTLVPDDNTVDIVDGS
jgi:LCP family protein required for cell wall assembly